MKEVLCCNNSLFAVVTPPRQSERGAVGRSDGGDDGVMLW